MQKSKEMTMRIKLALGVTVLCLLGTIGAFIQPEAQAIPAFARKYELSCNACHTRFPRLNTYGERFLENGYQLPGTEDGGILGKQRMGNLALDDVKNYLGVRMVGNPLWVFQQTHAASSAQGSTNDAEVAFPDDMKLYLMGTLARNVTLSVELVNSIQNKTLDADLAYVVFTNLGRPGLANLRVGRLDPSAFFSFPRARLQVRSVEREVDLQGTFVPPVVQRIALTPAAFSAKFNGLFEPNGTAIFQSASTLYNDSSQTGIDLYGRPFGDSFLYQIGMVNGTEERFGDSNAAKDWYAMGRYDYVRGDDFSANLSGLAYFGSKNAKLVDRSYVNWSRYGVAATVRYKMVDLYGAYLFDRVTGVAGSASSQFDPTASGLTVQADVLVSDQTLLSVRYDQTDAGGLRSLRKSNSLVTLQAKHYLFPNVSTWIQDTFNLRESEDGSSPERNLRNAFMVGLDVSF